jgi:hypothetical protein
MKILVVGLMHQLQSTTPIYTEGKAADLEKEQKRQYEEMLDRVIKGRGVQFIGEEAKHGTGSIAHQIARRQGREYANIEMEPAERQAKGIPPAYPDEESSLPPEEINRRHKIRESHMFDKTIKQAGSAESVLILCGRIHADALAQLFKEAGHTVETYDVNKEGWYIEDWAKHLHGS